MSSSLIRAKYVVRGVIDRFRFNCIEDGAVLQRDGMILAVGPYEEIAALPAAQGAEKLGSPDHVLLPGFVNAHHHVGLTPLQLGSPDLPLELWFASRLGSRAVDRRLDTLHSAFEMVESGITTVQHLHGRVPGDGAAIAAGANEVLGAYADIGMRASYAYMLRDQNRLVYEDDQAFLQRLPRDLAEPLGRWFDWLAQSTEDQLGAFRILHKQWADHPRIAIQLAPANLHWCSDAALADLQGESDRTGAPMHMHILETPYQKEYSLRRTGRSPVAHLHRLGMLSPKFTIGHGTWLTEADIELLADTGACVCHNCSSNFRLRSGMAPLNHLERRGITVGIGLDEAGINDDRDMLQEMRLVLRAHRVPGMDDQVPTPPQVLRMATAGSAATTPFSGLIGRLEPGMRCDAVMLRWSQVSAPFLDPDTDPIDAVILRAKTEGVDHVLVDGELIYADRKFTRINRAAATKELADRMAAPPSAVERERRTLAKGLIPHVKAFYADYLRDQDRTPFYSPSSRF